MPDKLRAEWFWTDRWMGSSGFLLPLEARGLYREMLTQAWRRGARLPNDPTAIQRACGVTAEEWDRCWPLVHPYWEEDGAHLVNRTQQEVYADASNRHDAAVHKARAAADARWSKARARAQADAQASPGQCPPSPSPSPSPKEYRDPSDPSSACADRAKGTEKVEPSFEARFVNLWNAAVEGSGIGAIRPKLSQQRKRHVRGWQKLVKGDTEALELAIRWFVARRLCDEAGVPRGISTFLRPSHREDYLEQARAWESAGRPEHGVDRTARVLDSLPDHPER